MTISSKNLRLVFILGFMVIFLAFPISKILHSTHDLSKKSPSAHSITTHQFQGNSDITSLLALYPDVANESDLIEKLNELFSVKAEYDRNDYQLTGARKVYIYGAQDYFYLVEYKVPSFAMSDYPWHKQFILTATGYPVKPLSAQDYELVPIFEDNHPLLLASMVTAKGNGYHELYQVGKVGVSLINVLDTHDGLEVNTYDCHANPLFYSPCGLTPDIQDMNRDGYNDLIFSGELVCNDEDKTEELCVGHGKTNSMSDGKNLNKVSDVSLVFIYDKVSKRFFWQDGLVLD